MITITDIKSISKAADTLSEYNSQRNPMTLFPFQKKNLIYGCNGSGKTTISRIFSYLGTGTRPRALGENFDFEIILSDKTKLTRKSELTPVRDRVLVYNEDYIEENFDWLEGSASPLVGLGKEQIKAQQRLTEARKQVRDHAAVLSSAQSAQKDADKKEREHARKLGTQIETKAKFNRRSFEAPQVRAAYVDPVFDPEAILEEAKLKEQEQILEQTNPPEALELKWQGVEDISDEIEHDAVPLLGKTATHVPLPELDVHPGQEPWIKAGYDYHRGHEMTQCLLCSNPITLERYEALAAHFSEEAIKIDRAVAQYKKRFEAYRHSLINSTQLLPKRTEFADQLRSQFDPISEELSVLRSEGQSLLDTVIQWLDAKLATPTKSLSIETDEIVAQFRDWVTKLTNALNGLSALVSKHNEAASDFESLRTAAQQAVKCHYLAEAHPVHTELRDNLATTKDNLATATAEQERLTKEIAELEAAQREHAPAANRINEELAYFLRHKGITMEPVEGGYKLTRENGTPVVKLSEGEKSAITFCYFIISLEAHDSPLKDVIVVVDDPISSLDTGALTYMASLIREKLNGAGQLFVSTHNASFMMEMRKWMVPASLIREASEAKKKNEPEIPIPLFQLTLRADPDGSNRTAKLENMSTLIRDYEGEYHYLYSMVHHYAVGTSPTNDPFLLLPNAMRRVLETFISFRAPSSQNLKSGINAIKDEVPNVPTLMALERFADMESHGDNLAALTNPATQTIEEAHPAAVELMKFIEVVDPEHHKVMTRLCNRNPVI